MNAIKSRSIKLLLERAKENRWTVAEWGIHIREIIHEDENGDTYDLADCIIQRALDGLHPLSIIISYLMYCLDFRIVSYNSVLQSICQRRCFADQNCTLSLVNLLNSFLPRIICDGKEEDCINLCKTMLDICHWLYSCICYILIEIEESLRNAEHHEITRKSFEALAYISNSRFTKSLLYVGKYEDGKLYQKLAGKHTELMQTVRKTQNLMVSRGLIQLGLCLIKAINNFPVLHDNNMYSIMPKRQRPLHSLCAMIVADVTLNLPSKVEYFVHQLALLKRFQNFTLPELYCKILYASFKGLSEAVCSAEYLRFAAFFFYKLPRLFEIIQKTEWPHYIEEERTFENIDDFVEHGENNTIFVNEVLQCGIEIFLMNSSYVLGYTDFRANTDCFQYLLNELRRKQLLTDNQMAFLLQRRNQARKQIIHFEESPNLILQAKSAVDHYCSSSVDRQKSEFLFNMISNGDFEVTLTAAAAMGKLQEFTFKILELNEFSKQDKSENEELSIITAIVFDITFLMLIYIIQNYGTQILTLCTSSRNSFFKWMTKCWPEAGKLKCSEAISSECNADNVSALLSQFINTNAGFKTDLVKWYEICFNAPMAMKELLTEWKSGFLSTYDMKIIINNIKNQMCCLPVCIATWLCNYINTLPHEERAKPTFLLQQFSIDCSAEFATTKQRILQSQDQDKYFFKDRSALMEVIIKKMINGLHSPTQKKTKRMRINLHSRIIRTSMWETVDSVFSTVDNNGWLKIDMIKGLDVLLHEDEGRRLCDTLIRSALWYTHIGDLQNAIYLIFGIFHIDIEACALALMKYVLPEYFEEKMRVKMLSEPHGSALAHLSVMTIYAALDYRPKKHLCKLSNKLKEISDQKPPNKVQQFSSDLDFLVDTPYGFEHSDDIHSGNIVLDPIQEAIVVLMRRMTTLTANCTDNQNFTFPIVFLEQVVRCGGNSHDQVRSILQFMPFTLIPQLVKISPDCLSRELIVSSGVMKTAKYRRILAKALCDLHILKHKEN